MKTKLEVKVTTEQLVDVLKTKERGTFCYIEMVTIPKMNKRNNPYFNQIRKVTKGKLLIGGNYQTRVINKTDNPDFVPEKCNVGEKIEDSCVLYNENLNRYYLQYEWFNEVKPKVEYHFGNDLIGKEIFESFLVKGTPNKYGVNFQSVNIDNIKRIHFDSVEYVVE